jgi:FkbM family methyltransferase
VFSEVYPEAFFIEIGANDGWHNDNLRASILSSRWSGIMVEPLPFVFERLGRNYGQLGRIVLENVAIADRDGELPFYHLARVEDPKREKLPSWYDQLGSFSREVVLSHDYLIPDIERRMVRTLVPCMTYEALCSKHGVRDVDLILIDTEGYDYEVIKQIDFKLHGPRMLVYEHFHLSTNDRAECRARIEQNGYETMEERLDTWCLKTAIDDKLTRTWRGLRPAIAGISAHDKSN